MDDEDNAIVVHQDKRRRVYEHEDGDDVHSEHSNDNLAQLNPPDISLRHYVEQANRELLYHSPETREEFINHVTLLIDDYATTLPQRLVQLADQDTAAFKQVQQELLYVRTCLHYFCLICTAQETVLLPTAQSLIFRLIDAEQMVIVMSRLYNHQERIQPILNFDFYKWLELYRAKEQKALLQRWSLEALVFREIEQQGFAFAIYLKGDILSNGEHNQLAEPAIVYFYKRSYLLTAEGRYLTHFYGRSFELGKLVQDVVEAYPASSFTQAEIRAFIDRVSRSPQVLERYAAQIRPEHVFMAFSNGVYVLPTDQFVPNDAELPRTTGVTTATAVPAIFHAQTFPYADYTDVQVGQEEFRYCKCDMDDNCRCRTARILNDIPTPALDGIMSSQNWPAGVRLMFFALLGRNLHKLHTLDEKYHLSIFLYGTAGGGKSTIGNLLRSMLRSLRTVYYKNESYIASSQLSTHLSHGGPADVIHTSSAEVYDDHIHDIDTKVEEGFPLQNAPGKAAFLASELRANTNLEQALVLKMASREVISIHIKNCAPRPMLWDLPGLFCANELPKWTDDNGEMSRRAVVLMFTRVPNYRDQLLPQKLEQELSNIILKANRIYLAWTKFCVNKEPYPNRDGQIAALQPSKYWKTTNELLMQQLNPIRGFWVWCLSKQKAELCPTGSVSKADIEPLYKNYLQSECNQDRPVMGQNVHRRLTNFFSTIHGVKAEIRGADYLIRGIKIIS